MPRATNGETELEYEVIGSLEDPVLLMVNGLGSQMVSWEDELLQGFVDRGFCIVRFDNREVGLSTKIDVDALAATRSGEAGEAPFHLLDMAADAIAVLDDLDVEAAHVLGMSMGGMIAQAVAIAYPEQVLSLTSIMSTTGDPDVGQPTPEVLAELVSPSPTEREAAIESSVAFSRLIGSPEHFDEDMARARHTRAYDRCFHPQGTANQMLAIVTSGSRSDALRNLDVPTLVLHGDADPLVDISGGRRTAEVVPGAELVVLEGMGHDLPTYFWSTIIENVTRLAARSAVGA